MSNYTWDNLGAGYPVDGLCPTTTAAAFNVLAPVYKDSGRRVPLYELGHETTPTPDEVWELAGQVAAAVLKAIVEWGR